MMQRPGRLGHRHDEPIARNLVRRAAADLPEPWYTPYACGGGQALLFPLRHRLLSHRPQRLRVA
jgi:hypothetical protein